MSRTEGATPVVTVVPLLKLVGSWEDFLSMETSELDARRLRRYERTGGPLGSESFTVTAERQLRRTLRRGKPDPQGNRASQISMVSPDSGGVGAAWVDRRTDCCTCQRPL